MESLKSLKVIKDNTTLKLVTLNMIFSLSLKVIKDNTTLKPLC